MNGSETAPWGLEEGGLGLFVQIWLIGSIGLSGILLYSVQIRTSLWFVGSPGHDTGARVMGLQEIGGN